MVLEWSEPVELLILINSIFFLGQSHTKEVTTGSRIYTERTSTQGRGKKWGKHISEDTQLYFLVLHANIRRKNPREVKPGKPSGSFLLLHLSNKITTMIMFHISYYYKKKIIVFQKRKNVHKTYKKLNLIFQNVFKNLKNNTNDNQTA